MKNHHPQSNSRTGSLAITPINHIEKTAKARFKKTFLSAALGMTLLAGQAQNNTFDNIYHGGSGKVRINGFSSSGNKNTEINPIDGVTLIGLDESAKNPSQTSQIHLMVKDFAMFTGTNPTITFKKNPANFNGDMAIEYYDYGPQTGINFFNPWPNNQNGGSPFMFFVGSTGNVGIGTGNPQHKLDVCGTIRGKEVLVQVGWCDYVFDKNYKLMPLKELDAFINKNHHLPNIPPASEVEGEGLKVAEMTARQMEKIEELTLYIIDLQKQIDELKNQAKN